MDELKTQRERLWGKIAREAKRKKDWEGQRKIGKDSQRNKEKEKL